MNYFQQLWARLRGKDNDPTFGAQIALLGGAVGVANARDDTDSTPDHTDAAADYGWSGDHMSGSDFGGGGAGGFDGGGGDDGGGS